jgi:crotonobetainyl-CoA:carnitine CoA-transferase CaiB-like acyl-CoA transferase
MTPEIRAELRAVFNEIFITRTTAEWSERLSAEQQRFAPVRSHAQVVADPQVAANDYIVEVDHPEWGRVKMVGCPITMSDTPTRWGTDVPELGQHTEEILLDFDFTWEEIGQLREDGAL